MKPCDCKYTLDIVALNEQGIMYNNKRITIDSIGVILEITPYVRIKIDHKTFKRFAEWYLEDQEVKWKH